MFLLIWAIDNIIKSDTITEAVINHPIYNHIIELRDKENPYTKGAT